MAKVKVKPIHLIVMRNASCRAVCDYYCSAIPIDKNVIKVRVNSLYSKGTFNPEKVTCKRCLKQPKYKEAMDRVKYPLLFLQEGIV